MPISDYLSSGAIEDLNTAGNLFSAAYAPQQLSIAKQSLNISKQLLYLFKDTHAKEERRDGDRDTIFLEILSELKKMNENIQNLGGIK